MSWHQQRKKSLERDDYECQGCGADLSPTNSGEHPPANVHHVTPRREGGGDDLENLITLCESCHDREHSGWVTGETSREALLSELREGRCTPAALIDWTGLSNHTVWKHLNVLVAAGHVQKIHDSGLYELVDDPREENDGDG